MSEEEDLGKVITFEKPSVLYTNHIEVKAHDDHAIIEMGYASDNLTIIYQKFAISPESIEKFLSALEEARGIYEKREVKVAALAEAPVEEAEEKPKRKAKRVKRKKKANICPECGHENKPTAKFCSKCGTRLV